MEEKHDADHLCTVFKVSSLFKNCQVLNYLSEDWAEVYKADKKFETSLFLKLRDVFLNQINLVFSVHWPLFQACTMM